MPDETTRIGSINISGISGEIQIGDITVDVKAGGDIVGRDKVVNHITQIVNQALSAVEEADKARSATARRLAEGVRDFAARLNTATAGDPDQGGPYRGLLAYRLSDAPLFFGRNEAIAELRQHLERGRLTILQAESGAGKSSLLQAGLSPRLLADGHLPVYIRPYDQPPGLAVKRAFLPNLADWPDLAQAPLRDFLRQVTGILGPAARLYLLLDQFEEFFTLLPEAGRATFVADLADCLEDEALNARWVLALRSEFFGDLANFRPRLRNPFENDYRLNRLRPAEALAAIIAPAGRQGVAYEPALLAALLADIRGDDGEVAPPQLQLVCSALYDLLPEGQTEPVLTLAMYEQSDRAQGILGSHLRRVLTKTLSAPERELARRLLVALVSSDQRRLRRTRSDLAAELATYLAAGQSLNDLLERLVVEGRLLNVEEDEQTNEPAYELAHDYLLAEIRLSPEEQARKAAQEMLNQEVEAYKRFKTLLNKEKFNIIYSQRDFLVLNRTAQELLRRSRAVIEAEARAKEVQRQRELAQAAALAEAQRKRAQITRRALIALAVLLLVAIGAAVFAFFKQQEAQDNADLAATREAETREQAALTLAQFWKSQGERVFEAEPLLGLRLAMEGWQLTLVGNNDTRLSIEQAIRDLAQDGRLAGLGSDIENIYPSGQQTPVLFIARTNAPAELRRTADGQLLETLAGPLANCTEVRVDPAEGPDLYVLHYRDGIAGELRRSPGGQRIQTLPGPVAEFGVTTGPGVFVVGYTGDISAELRSAAGGQLITALSGPLGDARFSSTKAGLFVVSYTGDIPSELRRASDGRVIATLSGPAIYNRTFFSPDEAASLLVVPYADNTPTEIRRTAGGQPLQGLSGPVEGVSFSPEASLMVVSYTGDITGELRRTADGQLIRRLSGPLTEQGGVFFPPTEASPVFAVSYANGLPGELRRGTDGQVIAPLSGQVDPGRLVFSPDDAASLMVVSYTGNISSELRRTADGQVLATLPASFDYYNLAFLPDDAPRFLVVPYSTTPGELRRMAGGQRIQTLPGPVEYVFYISQVPDLFLLSYPGDIPGELRRTLDGQLITTLSGPLGDMPEVVFSRDKAASVFVVGYPDNTFGELRRSTDGQVITPLSGPVGFLGRVEFDPDNAAGFFVVSYADLSIKPEVRRTADGQLIQRLSGPVGGVTFSPDETHRYFIVDYQDGQSELWQTLAEPVRLANLGLAREQSGYFDMAGDHMLARHRDGRTYLLDLAWLQAMGGQAQEMPIEQLIRLACEGPFANKQVWTEAAETKLKEYLGSRAAQACLPAQ